MNWDTISRRLERAAERVPTPAADAPFDPSIFTAAEIATMTAVAERYPAGVRAPDGSLAPLSDDDLAGLASIAARIKASRRDGGVMTEMTR